jgi:hemoglobin
VKKDLESREDLLKLLTAFYEKVFEDELIGHFFRDVMNVDLEKHIPVITDFWETVLFKGTAYRKNAVAVHMHINEKSPIEEQHFNRWLKLFGETMDEYFEGETAETAKQRALSIATVMRIKIATPPGLNIQK